jgi:hypothetical protein
MVLIAWNSSRSLSTSRTILLWSTRWIKSTFISANVLCHRNGLVFICAGVPKILQGHIVRVHLGIVQPHLVLSHLQTMYYDQNSFLMSWLSSLTTIELYALINNGHPTCINTPPMQNHLPRIYLKSFVKFRELEHGWRRQLVPKLSKGLVTKLIPLLG